jgi:Tol biopolymer transport system component
MKRPLTLLASVLVAGAVVPAAAHATLAYETSPKFPAKSSIYLADNDGTHAKRLAAGITPNLSPDGQTVVFATEGLTSQLKVSSTTAPAPKVLLKDYSGFAQVDWSPDSKLIATSVGEELKPLKLVIVDVATGARTTVATGAFSGVSFSPSGTQLVYTKGKTGSYLEHDLYVYDLATKKSTALLSDHRSLAPVWGPKTIVLTRLVDKSVRKYGPKGELYTISPTGKGLKRLTNQKVGQLLFGLSATAFSDDGTRLLAQFGGQDTSYAQVVNPATGKVRTLGKAEESGYRGMAISHDGKTVLAATGGPDPDSRHDLITVPYAGGPAKVLIKNVRNADWTR